MAAVAEDLYCCGASSAAIAETAGIAAAEKNPNATREAARAVNERPDEVIEGGRAARAGTRGGSSRAEDITKPDAARESEARRRPTKMTLQVCGGRTRGGRPQTRRDLLPETPQTRTQ